MLRVLCNLIQINGTPLNASDNILLEEGDADAARVPLHFAKPLLSTMPLQTRAEP
jgi:hypothetical protein